MEETELREEGVVLSNQGVKGSWPGMGAADAGQHAATRTFQYFQMEESVFRSFF